MPVSVIVGGQYGSEGKGKLAHWVAKTERATLAVRVGGPNSGHTVIDLAGRTRVFFHLPTAAILDHTICVLPAGAYICPQRLLQEIEACRLAPSRLWIDPNATLVLPQDEESEQRSNLRQAVGSTLSGTGAAVMGRISRAASTRLASSCKELTPFLRDTSALMRERLDNSERIVLEGTQGFGLSLLHSPHYPFVTSRDTTAASVVAEAGLSPLDVDDIVLVIRAFSIRVGGNSGPLSGEIDWDTVTRESGAVEAIIEHTSVTGRLRRVARLDPSIIHRAVVANRPTRIALNHLDHIDVRSRTSEVGTPRIADFVRALETSLKRDITLVGFGPDSVAPRADAMSEASPTRGLSKDRTDG
jgi:adenylosuccinate synthase